IIASIWLGNAILIEASLSFLGLGTQPPTPSWGLMLSSTGRAFMEQAPWLAVFPGLAISLAVLGFNLFGDTLRDAWDPKLRRQRCSARGARPRDRARARRPVEAAPAGGRARGRGPPRRGRPPTTSTPAPTGRRRRATPR